MDVKFRDVGRGPKWCPDHEGEYEGNFFTDYAGKPKGKIDDEGRVVHPCDDCIDKQDAVMKERSRAAEARQGGGYTSSVPDNMVWPGDPVG